MGAELTPALYSIRRYMVAGAAVVIFVTFGIGGWAATARIAGAVISQGVVVVSSSVKKVQHPTGGVVKSLLAHEGDRVDAGQILLKLDDTQVRSNASIISKSINELYARQARLEAERDGVDHVTFPHILVERAKGENSEAARAMVAELGLFKIRREAREGQKSQLQERSAQLQQEILGYTGQATAKDKEVNLIHQELEGVRTLWQKKLIPITRLTALERDTARLEGERAQLASTIAQTKGKIAEINLQIIQINQDLRSEVGKDLIDTRSKISELGERSVAAEDQVHRIDIRAPQSGYVHELSVHTIGGVINPGEQIMLIVPDHDALAVEVKIPPQDIDQVYIGQTAMMRFPAFNQRTTPEIKGQVSLVGADLTEDKRTGQSFYTVRIDLSATELSRLDGGKLVPGMPVEAFIQTNGRTALSYLIKPLRDQAEHAFKEK
jgi:HlyD family secretion protein